MDKAIAFLVSIYILTLSFVPEVGGIKGSIGDMILAGIILVYFIMIVISTNERQNLKDYFLDFISDRLSQFMILLVVIMGISCLFSMDRGIAIKETVRFLLYIMIFFIIKYKLNRDSFINLIINTYILNLAVVGLIGIYQFMFGSADNSILLITLNQQRIASTFNNPNSYGGYLVIAVFPFIMLALKEKGKRKILYSILSILVFSNIILTLSRGAWLGFAVGCGALALVYSWKFIFSYIIVGGLSLFIPSISGRIKDFTDVTQNEGRFKLWQTAGKMIKEHPILGVGNGNYISRYDEYTNKYPSLKMEGITRFPSHNSYLKVFSELGIFGIISFAGMLIFSVKRVIAAIKVSDGLAKHFYMGFLASMAGFYVMNIFDNMFFVPKIISYYWILLAVSQGIIYRRKQF